MARRKRETLDDLLKPILAEGRFTSWCNTVAGVRPWTVLRWRRGIGGRVHTGTVLAVAQALGVPPARVRAAIEASRAAAQ
jgi:hypothetical protein